MTRPPITGLVTLVRWEPFLSLLESNTLGSKMDKSSLVRTQKKLCNNADLKKSWNPINFNVDILPFLPWQFFETKLLLANQKKSVSKIPLDDLAKKEGVLFLSLLIVSNWRRPEVVKKAFEIFFITSSGKAKFLQCSGKIDSFLEWIFWSWRIVLSSHVIPFPHFHQYLAKNLRAFTIEASKNRKQTSKVFFPTLKSARSLTSKRPHQIMRIFGNPRFLSKNH